MVKEYFKSLSITSTTSVESGFYDDEEVREEGGVSEAHIGKTVKEILCSASEESRLICGWKEVIDHLNETEYPEHSLFFFLVPIDDKLSHMQEVMTRAFCLANDIYVVQLDSIENFNKILGSDKSSTHACALLQRSSAMKVQDADDEIEFTQLENDIIDYCEEFWCDPIQPIVRLPQD
jgi:hypothetical protein